MPKYFILEVGVDHPTQSEEFFHGLNWNKLSLRKAKYKSILNTTCIWIDEIGFLKTWFALSEIECWKDALLFFQVNEMQDDESRLKF